MHRRAGLDEGVDAMVRDPDMIALRRRIKAIPDATLDRAEARAAIYLKDGRCLAAHVTECRGSLARPMTEAELQEKFLSQVARHRSAGKAAHLADLCWNLPALTDVGTELCDALA